ncbi:MAG TPA: universal stress protein [Acidimicrobiales bacterium]
MNGPIVVGTDGSETAAVAVAEAIKIAKAFDQPLHIVFAFHPQGVNTRDLPPEFADAVQSDSNIQAVLDDVAARARASGVKTESHAVTGDAADAILGVAETIDAGLIVVGNKGINSVRRYVLGNIPSKVVHHSPCSTYVVHTT